MHRAEWGGNGGRAGRPRRANAGCVFVGPRRETGVSYNLLEERWIPVLGSDGKACRVGITAALTEAGTIRQIAASNPMDNVSLLRLLLAVLQWCKPKVRKEELGRLRGGGSVPQDWLKKLERNRAKFELLGHGGRFYQCPTARSKVERPVTDLLQELPSGTNIAHFRHTRDGRDGLCPACCAIGLVRLTAFATSGKHGGKQQKPAGINGPAPVYGVRWGGSLVGTLLLNWPLREVKRDGPSWAHGEPTRPEHIGPLRAFTWQPRRAWLQRPEVGAPERTCCSCGREDQLVHRIAFLPGWERPFANTAWPDDPHVLDVERRTVRGKNERKVELVRLARHSEPPDAHARSWREMYRGSLQRLRAGAAQGHAEAIVCTGAAARQALYKDALCHSWRLPVGALTKERAGAALRALRWLDRLEGTDRWGVRDGSNVRQMLLQALRLVPNGRPGATAALAAAATEGEALLRRHFEEFVDALAQADGDEEVRGCIAAWRNGVQTELRGELARACTVIASASPLRRCEAINCAHAALHEEIDRAAGATQGDPKEHGAPKGGGP